MPDLPLDQQTMFANLAERCLTAPRAGSVYRRKRGAIEYLYAKLDHGLARADHYIGIANDPDALAKAEAIERARNEARNRQSTVRLLRQAGFPAPDPHAGRLLSSIAASGLFDRGAVLVGTIAYIVLQPVIGVRLAAATLMTQDIDLSIGSLKVAADDASSFEEILAQVDPSYAPVPTLDGAGWPWRYRNASGYDVDILTATRSRKDGESLPLPNLKAGAAPLKHMKWLIANPLPTVALYGAGIPVRVPQPARFAVHKLILAQKRSPAHLVKRRKDLLQASALIEALRRHDPFAINDALREARAEGKRGWADPIARSLLEIGHSTL